MGVPPGPAVATILEDIETWWEYERYTPKRTECLKQLELAVKKFDKMNNDLKI